MISNFFMQLAHIELLMTYSVKDILSLVRRDARFDTKLVNDLFFKERSSTKIHTTSFSTTWYNGCTTVVKIQTILWNAL